jgi:hypothetical protein
MEEVVGRRSYMVAVLDYVDPADPSVNRTAFLEFWLDGSDRGRPSDYRDPMYWEVLRLLRHRRPDLFAGAAGSI